MISFGTVCSLGELRVNLWLSGPGKPLVFPNTVSQHGKCRQQRDSMWEDSSICSECFRGADTLGLIPPPPNVKFKKKKKIKW